MMQKVYQTEGITIAYDPDIRQLVQTWVGFNPSEEFRKAIDFSVGFVKQGRVDSLISDTTEQNVLSPADGQYAASTMPLLAEGGLKVMAFIMPQKVLTKMSVTRFSKSNESPVAIGHFQSMEEARSWIAGQLR